MIIKCRAFKINTITNEIKFAIFRSFYICMYAKYQTFINFVAVIMPLRIYWILFKLDEYTNVRIANVMI